jgi:RNA polymerase sigma-70 factor, ECF subfamily
LDLPITDEALALRAAGGDKDCFEEILVRHRDRVYRLCYRSAGNAEDAEDWAQECFLRIYGGLRQYDSGLPFLPWLLRVTSNTCINLARERGRRESRLVLDYQEETVGGSGPDPLASTLHGEEARETLNALQELKPLYRQAVILKVVEDLSFKELAEALGVPLPTAASWVRRGLLQVRDRLTKDGIEVDG